MNTLPLVDPDTATGAPPSCSPPCSAAWASRPNMTKAMANSPALLDGYLELFGALNPGVLDAATREHIALTVAQANSCSYCLSAHSYLAEHVAHLSADEIAAARRAKAPDPKTAAILGFATAVNDGRGAMTGDDVDAARSAGSPTRRSPRPSATSHSTCSPTTSTRPPTSTSTSRSSRPDRRPASPQPASRSTRRATPCARACGRSAATASPCNSSNQRVVDVHVSQLWRYPVKSLGAEALARPSSPPTASPGIASSTSTTPAARSPAAPATDCSPFPPTPGRTASHG